jgi:hypothetical protein
VVVYTIKRLISEGVEPMMPGGVEGISSNIRRIENALVETNIPCHVPMLETRRLTSG